MRPDLMLIAGQRLHFEESSLVSGIQNTISCYCRFSFIALPFWLVENKFSVLIIVRWQISLFSTFKIKLKSCLFINTFSLLTFVILFIWRLKSGMFISPEVDCGTNFVIAKYCLSTFLSLNMSFNRLATLVFLMIKNN